MVVFRIGFGHFVAAFPSPIITEFFPDCPVLVSSEVTAYAGYFWTLEMRYSLFKPVIRAWQRMPVHYANEVGVCNRNTQVRGVWMRKIIVGYRNEFHKYILTEKLFLG